MNFPCREKTDNFNYVTYQEETVLPLKSNHVVPCIYRKQVIMEIVKPINREEG